MYMIVVYDVKSGRTDKFKKYCRSKLTHVQDSVFEGQLKKSQAEDIKKKLSTMAQDSESVIIYQFWSDDYMDRTTIGEDPTPDDSFII